MKISQRPVNHIGTNFTQMTMVIHISMMACQIQQIYVDFHLRFCSEKLGVISQGNPSERKLFQSKIWSGNPHLFVRSDTSAWKYESSLSSEWNLCRYGPVVVEITSFEVGTARYVRSAEWMVSNRGKLSVATHKCEQPYVLFSRINVFHFTVIWGCELEGFNLTTV